MHVCMYVQRIPTSSVYLHVFILTTDTANRGIHNARLRHLGCQESDSVVGSEQQFGSSTAVLEAPLVLVRKCTCSCARWSRECWTKESTGRKGVQVQHGPSMYYYIYTVSRCGNLYIHHAEEKMNRFGRRGLVFSSKSFSQENLEHICKRVYKNPKWAANTILISLSAGRLVPHIISFWPIHLWIRAVDSKRHTSSFWGNFRPTGMRQLGLPEWPHCTDDHLMLFTIPTPTHSELGRVCIMGLSFPTTFLVTTWRSRTRDTENGKVKYSCQNRSQHLLVRAALDWRCRNTEEVISNAMWLNFSPTVVNESNATINNCFFIEGLVTNLLLTP